MQLNFPEDWLYHEDNLIADIYSSNCQFHGTTNLQETSTAYIHIYIYIALHMLSPSYQHTIVI